LTNFALTKSNHVSMLYANPRNQQALNDQLNQTRPLDTLIRLFLFGLPVDQTAALEP
jgi:hypothetical protein